MQNWGYPLLSNWYFTVLAMGANCIQIYSLILKEYTNYKDYYYNIRKAEES